MRFNDGDMCPGVSSDRVSSDIYFICDETVGEGTPRLVSSKDNCQYLFNWKTSAACEKKSSLNAGGLSGVGIACIVLLGVVVVYLVAGLAFNRFVRGQKGVAQIPHFTQCQTCYIALDERLVCRSLFSFFFPSFFLSFFLSLSPFSSHFSF